MEYTMFADESGTTDGNLCFTIGCLLVPSDKVDSLIDHISSLLAKYDLPTEELKWENIRKSYGRINLIIDLMNLIQSSRTLAFVSMVTHKGLYNNWKWDAERAFYVCYTHLMSYCADRLNSEIKAKIDDRQDSYAKHHEVVQIISNHRLKSKVGAVNKVERCNSRTELLIQVADLLTGAINSAHNNFLYGGKAQMHIGKSIAIQKIAECLGWDHLHYDTWPNSTFNIWHFPEEYRANPKTEILTPNFNVLYVSPEDFN